MKNKNNVPELLAPAGSFDALIAAINSGANAVYLGGKSFSARANANNFSNEEIKDALDYASIVNVKIFVTINTLIKEEELNDALKFISYLYQIGVNAIIVQDIGLYKLIKENFKDIEVHASTQMSIHNKLGVELLKEWGFDRVVLSRELQIDEISEICNEIDIPIETFAHGALCMSYSGQCFMSSFIGGRSGNRGNCAQPCRKKYKLYVDGKCVNDDYVLSLRDICTLKILDKISVSGVSSLKIEGRMKSPEYVAGVTKIYRKYIDKVLENVSYNEYEEDRDMLMQLFNRGEFIQGYYNQKKGKNMLTEGSPKNKGLLIGKVKKYRNGIADIESECRLLPGDGIKIVLQSGKEIGGNINNNNNSIKINDNINVGDLVYITYNKKINDEFKKVYKEKTMKRYMNLKITAKINEPLKLIMYDNLVSIEVEGNNVDKAINLPMSKDRIVNQFSKLGNTNFKANEIEIIMDDDIFISIKEINELKREAVRLLEDKIRLNIKRKHIDINYLPKIREEINTNYITVEVNNISQFNQVINYKIKRIYIPYQVIKDELEKNILLAHDKNIEVYITMPYILRQRNLSKYKKYIDMLEKYNIDGYLIRTYGEYNLLRKSKKKICLDYTFNIFNNSAVDFWKQKGINEVTISVEQNECNYINKDIEKVIYGYIPGMITEQCIVKNKLGECKKSNGNIYIVNEKEDEFLIKNICENCLNLIYINNPINNMQKLEYKYNRLIFTNENSKIIENIMNDIFS